MQSRPTWAAYFAFAAALRALVLGDRLPPDARERLARTGTLHFFAVSGLHLALLAAALIRLFGPRASFLLPPLVVYAAISGFRTPVGRALLMIASVVGARAFRRPHRALHQVLLAATIILAMHPRSLTTPGFLLSFSAYAGIVGIAVPVLYPVFPFVWAVLLLQMVAGLADSMGWLGAQVLIGQHMRGRAFYAGRLSASVRIGHLIGPPLIGWIWDAFGPWSAFIGLSVWGLGFLVSAFFFATASRATLSAAAFFFAVTSRAAFATASSWAFFFAAASRAAL